MLSDDDVKHFNEQGYVIIENVLSTAQIDAMKRQALTIIQQDSASQFDSNRVFTTQDNDRTNNDFFLNSAETIACFFEEGAYDANGHLVQAREQCINKIGHALHELDPIFKPLSHLPKLGVIAHQLGIVKPEIRQSMFIFKQPRIGGVVNWHQDATFFYTTPMSVVTYWFALDDATLDNGCLWVEKNGAQSPLRERLNRHGKTTTMIQLDSTPWPNNTHAVPIEAKAGTLVCFKGNLPHYSAANRSDASRRAYTLHVTDATAHYAESNWLQTTTLPLRGFDVE